MYHNTDDNKLGKLAGVLATVCYVAMWILLIIFISFEHTEHPSDQGILIDFGTSETGKGTTDLAHVEPQKVQTTQRKVESKQVVTTQEVEPAPAIKTDVKVEPTPTEVEKPREVNKKALFKGSTQQSPSKSEGESTGEGNQGHELGAAGGQKTGTGQGDQGQSFDLRGRNLIGELPKPSYEEQEQGRVIIRIVVSSRGDVSSASFQSAGSTTQNPNLINAAIEAAKKAKFNSTQELTPQQGTITYIFRLT